MTEIDHCPLSGSKAQSVRLGFVSPHMDGHALIAPKCPMCLHLAGVGNRSLEWTEFTGVAYHVRRRLTPEEQAPIGYAVDCRGTDEGGVRLDSIRGELHPRLVEFALRELEMR